jgi:hypothetical protein
MSDLFEFTKHLTIRDKPLNNSNIEKVPDRINIGLIITIITSLIICLNIVLILLFLWKRNKRNQSSGMNYDIEMEFKEELMKDNENDINFIAFRNRNTRQDFGIFSLAIEEEIDDFGFT